MSEVNWDLAPEGADRLLQDGNELLWGNSEGEYFDQFTDIADGGWRKLLGAPNVIATCPTQTKTVADNIIHKDGYGTHFVGKKKTVEDALEYYKNVWDNDNCDAIAYNPSTGKFSHYRLVDGYNSNWYHVCTRKQFGACAAKKGEKWTHTYGHAGYKCKVISVNGEHSWILTENGDKLTEYTSSLKPIKPTISEVEAWRLVSGRAMTLGEVKEKYEVVKLV